ncbi:hypothetical protein D3C75_722590 [compost metagenome]
MDSLLCLGEERESKPVMNRWMDWKKSQCAGDVIRRPPASRIQSGLPIMSSMVSRICGILPPCSISSETCSSRCCSRSTLRVSREMTFSMTSRTTLEKIVDSGSSNNGRPLASAHSIIRRGMSSMNRLGLIPNADTFRSTSFGIISRKASILYWWE